MPLLLALPLLLAASGKNAPDARDVSEKESEPVRVLMVVSAATELSLADGTPMRVGYWANEVEVPLTRLRAAGYSVDVVTPGGKRPAPDPVSLPRDPAKARATRDTHAKLPGLASPGSLEALDAAALDRYAAIVIPGGYAPMADLASSEAMGRLLRAAMKKGTVIAAICHGPAALLSTRTEGEPWPFTGYRMAPFTNAEEKAWLKDRRLAWQLEDALRASGAKIESGGLWQSVVVRDRNVITAQNSPSVHAFTDALLAALAERRSRN